MNTIQIKSNFKKVSDEKNPRCGQKRDSVFWEFKGYEPEDIPVTSREHISIVLNDALEKYGKDLIGKNADNWEYSPQDVTLEALVAAITAETTRKRTLTKESLSRFSVVYAIALLDTGVPSAAVKGAQNMIENSFRSIAGNVQVLEKLLERVQEVVSILADTTTNSKEIEYATEWLSDNMEVYDAIINKLETLIADAGTSIDASSL